MIAEHQPDIVCLQEALEKDCTDIAARTGYELKFVLATRVERLTGTLDGWGVAVLTRVPVRQQTVSIHSENALPSGFIENLTVTPSRH